jgi:hypothetical protein
MRIRLTCFHPSLGSEHYHYNRESHFPPTFPEHRTLDRHGYGQLTYYAMIEAGMTTRSVTVKGNYRSNFCDFYPEYLDGYHCCGLVRLTVGD